MLASEQNCNPRGQEAHMNENFTVKFWGVRGSHPTPGPQTVYYGGNTACVEVRAGGHTLILDAGTGIIPLGRELIRQGKGGGTPPRPVLILFSHLHHDHTQGFPFFGPAYNPAACLHLYGPGASEQALEEVLTHNQTPPAFPVTLRDMNAAKEIRSLTEADNILIDETGLRLTRGGGQTPPEAVVIRLMKSYAHPGGVYVYRIEWRGRSVVYATDTEGYVGGDRRLMAFARGADLLIHDAQYAEEHYRGLNGWNSTQGYGHSTPQMAAELASAAGVKQLALFHHDPNYDDETVHDLEEQAQVIFKSAFAAREGLEVDLSVEHKPVMMEHRQRVERSALHPV
jgi:phosphoribosyl 1,2-cyclic phosphodiesterase